MRELSRFLLDNSPDRQSEMAMNQQQCYFGDFPVLSELRADYGDNAPIMWLSAQLKDLSEYCGAKEKFSKQVLKQCASVIATEFFYLKTSELMLFFHNFKAGKYGEFYGAVDPIRITSSIRRFLADRNIEYDKKEQEEREERRMKARIGAVSYERYKEMLANGEIPDNPSAVRSNER